MKSKNNGKKEFAKDGVETDLIFFKNFCCHRAGKRKWIKRKMSKRFRYYYKTTLKNETI
ncbi:hypothetical protein [Ornithobacterium rhinotracheale]|uniref:hypothetical protein n=1 Tax=Ornithobacterium rhinotracheale TaxID=28251 RepID=UPI0040374BCA